MNCKRCGCRIPIEAIKCPNCGKSLNTKINFNEIKPILNITMSSILIIVGSFFITIILSVILGFLTILGKGYIIPIIFKFVFALGIIILTVNIFLLIKRVREQLNNNYASNIKPVKKISITWFVFSAFLIIFPIVSKNLIKMTTNLDLIDYSTVEKITLSNIDIPTLYSTVGRRDIIFNLGISDEYDYVFDINYDAFIISYAKLSNSDVEKYQEELIKEEYLLIKIIGEDDSIVYVKNDINTGQFITISIDDNNFNYLVGQGTFEDYFKDYEIIENE